MIAVVLPNPPTNLQVTGRTVSSTAASISLSWSAALSNSPLASFYTVTSLINGISANVSKSQTATTLTVKGITPGTNVTYCVVSSNAMGTSNPVCVNVLAAAVPNLPLSAPRCGDVTFTPTDASLVVKWDPSSAQLNGAPLQRYHIGVTMGVMSIYADTAANTTSIQMDRLPAGQSVGIQYSLCNAVGCSEMSPTAICTLLILSPAPIPPVAYITTLNVTTGIIQVSLMLYLDGYLIRSLGRLDTRSYLQRWRNYN